MLDAIYDYTCRIIMFHIRAMCLKLFAGSPLNDFAIFLLRDLKYFLNNFAIFLHRDLKEEAPDTLSAGSYNSQQQGK